ncbi:MAG: Regulator of RpoS [Phycisphaerae bacterium]|nr:Regulator of RpoS [Phycisphaerae bacterium]
MSDKPVILLADDQQSLRQMLALLLSRAGYAVQQARDGLEALELADRITPDLLLLDIRMPRLDGISLLRRLRRERGWHMPAIILTGVNQREEVVAAARAGASDYIVKNGFDTRRFLRKIAQFVPASADSGEGDPPAADDGVPADLLSCPPAVTRANLPQEVERISQVRALPFVIPQVLTLSRSQFSTADQLVRAIEPDPAMTAKVLAIANSSLYSRGRDPVTSLAAAVKNIGFESVRQAALGMGLIDLFSRDADQSVGIQRVHFWEHTFAAACVARRLAEHADLDESLAFVLGLLHQIGRLIQDEFYPDALGRLLEWTGSDRIMGPGTERRIMGVPHNTLARAVMARWRLPDAMTAPVGDYRLPSAALLTQTAPRRRWAALVLLAEQIAACVGLGDKRLLSLVHVPDGLADDFGLDDDTLSALRDVLPAEIRELKMLMLTYLPSLTLVDRPCPVSQTPLLYLRPRSVKFDVFEMFLRLRHRKFALTTDADAFIGQLAEDGPSTRGLVNLLPSPSVERAFFKLDHWSDPPTGPGRLVVLARSDQIARAQGPWTRSARFLTAPVWVSQLERVLELERQEPAARRRETT